jgi:hypothetical protein
MVLSSTEDIDTIPQTKAEAQKHIASIRAEKLSDRTESNTTDLEAALLV